MMWTCIIKWKPLTRSQTWLHVWCFVVDVWFIFCWLMFDFLGPIQRDSFSLWPGFFGWVVKTQWDFLFAMDLQKRCWKTDLTSFNVGPKTSCKYGPITPLIGVQEKQRNTFVLRPFIGAPRIFVGGIGSGVGHLGDFHILGTEEILERLKPVEAGAVTSLGLVVMNAIYIYIHIYMGWNTTAELYWDYVISHEIRISRNVIGGKKRSGNILQLWSIFPVVWMVWVGPKKHDNWEITEKWDLKIGKVQQNAKMYLSFFCWWILGVPEMSICQLLGLRTCIFTVEQNMWPCHAVTPVDLQGGSTMTNWFFMEPCVTFINEAQRIQTTRPGGLFQMFSKFHHNKDAEDEPQFWLSFVFSIW